MKSTDLIQPLPMVSPIANQGAKFNIPQNPTSAGLASVIEGFPEITMQSLKAGGLPPRGQDANGMFYLSTDQRVFLQNGGIITFSQEVSDIIGGYPKNAILDYIDENDVYCKVQSLIDDNTNNFVENPLLIDDINWKKVSFDGAGGSGSLPLGTMFFSQGYVDETKGLQIKANGQILSNNANTKGFIDWVVESAALNSDFATTEQNWQAEAALNPDGICGKYVINYGTDNEVVSVRLPKMPDWAVQSLYGNVPVVPANMNLSTPFTDGVNNYGLHNSQPGQTGRNLQINAGSYKAVLGVNTSGGTQPANNMTARIGDLSGYTNLKIILSNINSTKIKGAWYIQIATGAETENNIKNEFQSLNPYHLFEPVFSDTPLYDAALRGANTVITKAAYPDFYSACLIEMNPEIAAGTLVNISDTFSWTKLGKPVKAVGASDITDYDFVVDTNAETVTLAKKYKYSFVNDTNSIPVIGNGKGVIFTNGTIEAGLYNNGSSRDLLISSGVVSQPVTSTAPSNIGNITPGVIGFSTDPAKASQIVNFSNVTSGGYLYFRVANTIQNAAIMNAGRIEETKADKSQLDGPWVLVPSPVAFLEISLPVTTGSTSTYNLASMLPNDNNAYEINLLAEINTLSKTGAIAQAQFNGSGIRQRPSFKLGGNTTAAVSQNFVSTGNCVIAADRKLLINSYVTVGAGSLKVWLYGYRRKGVIYE